MCRVGVGEDGAIDGDPGYFVFGSVFSIPVGHLLNELAWIRDSTGARRVDNELVSEVGLGGFQFLVPITEVDLWFEEVSAPRKVDAMYSHLATLNLLGIRQFGEEAVEPENIR